MIGHPYLIVEVLCSFRLWYHVVMRVDTFWYDSLRLGAIWSRLADFWWHGLPRSVLLFRYDYIRSDRITCESRGGTVGPDPPLPPPPKNHKNIGFLSNTGPDPLKNHKAAKPAFNFGPSSARQRNAIWMALRRRADDSPLLVLFGSSFPLSNHDLSYDWTRKYIYSPIDYRLHCVFQYLLQS